MLLKKRRNLRNLNEYLFGLKEFDFDMFYNGLILEYPEIANAWINFDKNNNFCHLI